MVTVVVSLAATGVVDLVVDGVVAIVSAITFAVLLQSSDNKATSPKNLSGLQKGGKVVRNKTILKQVH